MPKQANTGELDIQTNKSHSHRQRHSFPLPDVGTFASSDLQGFGDFISSPALLVVLPSMSTPVQVNTVHPHTLLDVRPRGWNQDKPCVPAFIRAPTIERLIAVQFTS